MRASRSGSRIAGPLALGLVLLAGAARADGGVTFTDIAKGDGAGIAFRRARSLTFAGIEALRQQSLVSPVPFEALAFTPTNTAGMPGVAILDYDGDGDLDIYVTNGPGAPNSLYRSQLADSGALEFVDVGAASGAAATDQDSTGVCYGDTDNDGDPDLLVLGRSEPGRFFVNDGDGTFSERAASGLGGGSRSSTSCSMGDVNGDGLLDVVVANAWDFRTLEAILIEPFALNEHNQLFVNLGRNAFADVSAAAGVETLGGLPPGVATITWATAMADVDLDGDVDIVFADDQGAIPSAKRGGLDRGFLHVLLNDGTGQFSDAPIILNPTSTGAWMGLAFGDFDCDGGMDVFGSNFGAYNQPAIGAPHELGESATRLMLGNGDGTFTDPGVGGLVSSAFGWGNGTFDYDNDGDQDIVYHGSLDFNFVMFADNPGVLLQNRGCSADFAYDNAAFLADHQRRNVRGAALGDLNADGFVDVVSASNANAPAPIPLVPSPAVWGSVLDATAHFVPLFAPTPAGFVWTGIDLPPGTLSVEINSADNGNHWAAVSLLGGVDLTRRAVVNRDGIGAVVSFTPDGGRTVLTPIQGGSSHLSQHGLEAGFGLGPAAQGTAEVLWPGGVRNRLHNVRHGERVLLPEIPCSFDAEWPHIGVYAGCVVGALDDLVDAGAIDAEHALRLLVSALVAFVEER